MLDVGSGVTARWVNKGIVSRFSTPVFSGGRLYSTSEPGNLVCLNPANGAAVWTQSGFEWGGLVAVDGTLIVQNGSNGDLVQVALSPQGYKELGRLSPFESQTDQNWAAPIVAQGRLFARSKKELVCIDLK